jgi:p-aminobenzoyl-glutamate transporter AbgT
MLAVWPADSPLRSPEGEITAFAAPLMRSIVPLIFLFFLVPASSTATPPAPSPGTATSSRG